jgi:hypothetical protein
MNLKGNTFHGRLIVKQLFYRKIISPTSIVAINIIPYKKQWVRCGGTTVWYGNSLTEQVL